jgi:lysophospholipase L1-like esterase
LRALAKVVVVNLVLIALVFVAAELVARGLEQPAVSTVPAVGPDPELGWAPIPNVQGHARTSEFDHEYYTNELGLFDDPIDMAVDRTKSRILALGDSHTMATGVAPSETWANQLERLLIRAGRPSSVYNAGVGGYSIDQYLVRFRKLRESLDPHVVIVAFSTATDFIDVGRLPGGGFVYGSERGRIYFSLDERGSLVEHRELVGLTLDPGAAQWSFSILIRDGLQQLALYRLLKRSQLAVWVVARWTPGGQSLWPGLDTALKVTPDPEDERRMRLAEAILARLAEEVRAIGATPVLLHIPYLAQVYDEVWSASFGAFPDRFQRDLASRRLAAIADRAGMVFVDAWPAMVEEVRRSGRWLHYRLDAHPTPEGHAVIARTLVPVIEPLLQKMSAAPASD